MNKNRFENREHAGKTMAETLMQYKHLNPVVLALPRGGVPIAFEIANQLQAPLDVILVKKIGAPGHEEFAIGAVAEDEKPILNHKVIKQYQFNPEEIENIIGNRITEIRNRSKTYRKLTKKIPLEGRNVIVVDDGLATGATMLAAVRWLRTQKINKIIVAVPVSSKEAASEIKKLVDEFISLHTPENFIAVGMWYKDFPQVSDEEVLRLLSNKIIKPRIIPYNVIIEDENIKLQGIVRIPQNAKGIILFAHGGNGIHKHQIDVFMANSLNNSGFATLLINLLTESESLDQKSAFNVELLTKRLLVATRWVKANHAGLAIGYFGTSIGTAAAIKASKDRLDIFAIVSLTGRPDLAHEVLAKTYAPALLMAGANDKTNIPYNKMAKEELTNAKIVLIPHVAQDFEDPETLKQIALHTINWFKNSIILHLDKSIIAPIKQNIINEIEQNSTPFSIINDLDLWLSEVSKYKIVMLGEATHGSKEFYSIRKEISKRLIENYGYNFIAIEGDWPECNKLNEYIKGDIKEDSKKYIRGLFHRWPTWLWANEETPELIDWMKTKQLGGIYGLDVYSLFGSLEEIKKQLVHIEPRLASQILEGYKCFDSYNGDEVAYAKSLLKNSEGCLEEVTSNLRVILRLRLQDTNLSKEALFDLKQNARVIVSAEKYYRAMITGGVDSWNIRDLHMMETLENLLNLHGPDSKVIVWAHNTHIGDYHATDMLENGYLNLGGLARERFGVENVFLLGLSTYQGEVTAGSSWGGVEKKLNLPKAKDGTYEDYFHQASINMSTKQFLTEFKTLDKSSFLNGKLDHRAIGMVYDPNHESHGNYIPTQMAKRYDGMLFVDQTSALKSLPTVFTVEEFPDSWPQGQ